MTLDLLRFTTAGSVDDGKSTLIGRLLYDSKQVFEDQLAQVAQASERRGGEGTIDLALLTDGLRAEREQGITIDVAYRYFATATRRFIIADCPGHRQYTRNMVTGASTADVSVVLIDARRGVLEQSKRHAFISALLGIPQMVVAINKMDLVDYSQARYEELVEEFEEFARKLRGGKNPRKIELSYIPMSALVGDNVVERSENMSWYDGPVLLELLEQVEVAYDHPDERPARFPVQWVIRPGAGIAANGAGGTASNAAGSTADGGDTPDEAIFAASDYRGYAGQLASGALRRGDEVAVLPGGGRTRIAAIDTYDGELEEAMAPMSLTLRLEDELDISRGELICHPDEAPVVARELEADVCWMTDEPLRPGARYVIKQTSHSAVAVVDAIEDLLDVHTLERVPAPAELALNDIGRVHLRTSAPLVFDPYASNRRTGSFILIDESRNGTVGAGMIIAASGTPLLAA
jgi:sulfate adenylyltransferase subunit 1 (EFTu-like GTPase family)